MAQEHRVLTIHSAHRHYLRHGTRAQGLNHSLSTQALFQTWHKSTRSSPFTQHTGTISDMAQKHKVYTGTISNMAQKHKVYTGTISDTAQKHKVLTIHSAHRHYFRHGTKAQGLSHSLGTQALFQTWHESMRS